MAADNPFERYGLDPRDGIAAITQRLKELAEDTTDPAERDRIRAAWEELTLHPARRLRAALEAHPETRAPLGTPPPLPRMRANAQQHVTELELRDLAARPSAVGALPASVTAVAPEAAAPSLDDDPLF
jgi:hypothetical protein